MTDTYTIARRYAELAECKAYLEMAVKCVNQASSHCGEHGTRLLEVSKVLQEVYSAMTITEIARLDQEIYDYESKMHQ